MFGRFMLPDMSEHPCQVKELSLDGAVFITGQVPQGGTQLVAYIDDVGRVKALSAEERQRIKYWAEKYVRNAAYCLENGIHVSRPLPS